MKRTAILLTLSAASVAAQTPPVVNASISGVVKAEGTGKPLPNYAVSTYVNATWVNNTILMSSSTKEVKTTTDESGRYRLSDLPPGPYELAATSATARGSQLRRRVTIGGHDLENIDFSVVVPGVIRGKVLDENKEPVPGMMVSLISREYFLGTIGYFFASAARTNDQGEYTLPRVNAGTPYLIMAEKQDLRLATHSDVPLNPKLRRPVPMRTWYLNSAVREGAVPVMIAAGEIREGVNVEIKKSPSYCMDGTLTALGIPGPLRFSIEPQQPSSGVSNTGGTFRATPGGVTGDDGRYRICDLYPGSYRFTVTEQRPTTYAIANVIISDRDLNNFDVSTASRVEMRGEVVLDGTPPATPLTSKVSVNLQPLLRTQIEGEKGGGRFDIPGTFSLTGLLRDVYGLRTTLNAPGLYVKDVTYAGVSVLYEAVHVGSAIGDAGLRVIIGQDGGKLSAHVTDKDGNPVPDSNIIIMPAEIPSESALSVRFATGSTDQTGLYTSHTLPPGKYYVAATPNSSDNSPEKIDRLWRSRNHFTEVDLPPGGNARVDLQPVIF